MATTGDGMALYELRGRTKENFHTSEDPQNVSGEAGQYVLKEKFVLDSTIFTGQTPLNPTTIKNLPEEILLNIFIRLLAKQLAQMRSVSKSWNALLSESSFVKSHLHRSIHNNNNRILLVFNWQPLDIFPGQSHGKICTAVPCQSPHLKLNNFIKIPTVVNPGSGYRRFQFIGSVNGLICSSYDDVIIQIWNPSLSAVSTLPSFSLPLCCSYYTCFRFGFDPKTDDYKVVKVAGVYNKSSSRVTQWLQVEVYSMRKGSWKFTTENIPSHITGLYDVCGISVDGYDGRLHWVTFSETILAFDLGLETFHEMPLPCSDFGQSKDVVKVLAGKVCVMRFVENVGCEVWVMEEYGVAESWVKRYAFSQFIGCFGFTLNKKCLLIDDDHNLVLYDPVAVTSQILRNFCYSVSNFMEYVDSLVWVEPAEREGQN